MKPHCLTCAAVMFLAGAAQAQVVEQAPGTFTSPARTAAQESFD